MVVRGLPVLRGHLAGGAGEPEHVPVGEVELAGLRTAEAHGALDDDVEDLAWVVAGPAERDEDVLARHRLLASDVELPVLLEGAIGLR